MNQNLSNSIPNSLPPRTDNKSSNNSPKPNCKSSSDRSDSPVICETSSSNSQTASQSGKNAGYLNVSNLSKSLTNSLLSKMSKANSLQHSLNNENNINKHNINNNLSSIRSLDSIEKQQAALLTPLVRFRRLITSIYQHANNIAPETGDRAHALILGLVVSSIAIDDHFSS